MRTWYDMIKIIVGPAILVLAALTTTTTAAHTAFAFNTQIPQIQTPQIQLSPFPSLPNTFPFRVQIPPIQFPNQFPFNGQPLTIPPQPLQPFQHLPPIQFPNQFPFNFNGQPIPIPPLSPIQLPQQTQQNYPNSVSQNTQCNNGSCTTIICTNGACQTQTSSGSTVSVTTQCINGVCTTTYH
jgi:hypothetical protein